MVTYRELVEFLREQNDGHRLDISDDGQSVAWTDKDDDYDTISIMPWWKLAAIHSYFGTNGHMLDDTGPDHDLEPLNAFDLWEMAEDYADGCDASDFPIAGEA